MFGNSPWPIGLSQRCHIEGGCHEPGPSPSGAKKTQSSSRRRRPLRSEPAFHVSRHARICFLADAPTPFVVQRQLPRPAVSPRFLSIRIPSCEGLNRVVGCPRLYRGRADPAKASAPVEGASDVARPARRRDDRSMPRRGCSMKLRGAASLLKRRSHFPIIGREHISPTSQSSIRAGTMAIVTIESRPVLRGAHLPDHI